MHIKKLNIENFRGIRQQESAQEWGAARLLETEIIPLTKEVHC